MLYSSGIGHRRFIEFFVIEPFEQFNGFAILFPRFEIGANKTGNRHAELVIFPEIDVPDHDGAFVFFDDRTNVSAASFLQSPFRIFASFPG